MRKGKGIHSVATKWRVRGLRVMMTNVRASNLHPTLQEDILRSWPFLTNPPFCLSSILLPFAFTLLSRVLAEFPVCRGRSRASCTSLPSCLQREQPSSRRFGKLPLFLSCANISAASKRRVASRRFSRSNETFGSPISKRCYEGSCRIPEHGLIFSKK